MNGKNASILRIFLALFLFNDSTSNYSQARAKRTLEECKNQFEYSGILAIVRKNNVGLNTFNEMECFHKYSSANWSNDDTESVAGKCIQTQQRANHV